MIALTLGGALILFTCITATLWMIGPELLCCLLFVRKDMSSFPNDPSPIIWPTHSEELCPEHT